MGLHFYKQTCYVVLNKLVLYFKYFLYCSYWVFLVKLLQGFIRLISKCIHYLNCLDAHNCIAQICWTSHYSLENTINLIEISSNSFTNSLTFFVKKFILLLFHLNIGLMNGILKWRIVFTICFNFTLIFLVLVWGLACRIRLTFLRRWNISRYIFEFLSPFFRICFAVYQFIGCFLPFIQLFICCLFQFFQLFVSFLQSYSNLYQLTFNFKRIRFKFLLELIILCFKSLNSLISLFHNIFELVLQLLILQFKGNIQLYFVFLLF